MLRIGGTGHRSLPPLTARLVAKELERRLSTHPTSALVGLTSLADGADQLFARAVLAAGGALHVIVPARQYRAGLPPEAHEEYDALLALAGQVEPLPFEESTEEAHMAAGRSLVTQSDLLLAVWDGRPARGVGGTADVVALARELGVPVDVVWPEGAVRG